MPKLKEDLNTNYQISVQKGGVRIIGVDVIPWLHWRCLQNSESL